MPRRTDDNTTHRRPDYGTFVLKNVTVSVDGDDWEAFKKLMMRRRLTPSYALRLFIRAELRKARRDGELSNA
jgi:hypothetical protein